MIQHRYWPLSGLKVWAHNLWEHTFTYGMLFDRQSYQSHYSVPTWGSNPRLLTWKLITLSTRAKIGVTAHGHCTSDVGALEAYSDSFYVIGISVQQHGHLLAYVVQFLCPGMKQMCNVEISQTPTQWNSKCSKLFNLKADGGTTNKKVHNQRVGKKRKRQANSCKSDKWTAKKAQKNSQPKSRRNRIQLHRFG